MTADWAGRMNLPGPSNFVADAAAAVAAGRSLVVVLPAHLVSAGGAGAVLDALDHASHATELDPGLGRSALPNAIEQAFALGGRWRSSPDLLRDLAQSPTWQGECITIRAWDYDVGMLLARWGSLMSEQSVDPDLRPRFVVVARRADLDEAQLERVDLLHVEVHWWWGAVDRLDTEATLARTATRARRDPMRRAVIAEIAGWDLDLAEHLQSTWNGEFEDLDGAIRTYPCPEGASPGGPNGVPGSTPLLKERDAWDAGLLESWDGGRRRTPWLVSDEELRTSLWRAQNRIFMPRLNERRAHIEREFLRVASPELQDRVRNADGVCELGPMQWATTQGVRLSPQTAVALQLLTQLRNRLAHGQPAEARLLRLVQPHL